MGRAYAQFLPKVRNVRDYDAVLINREATLIGPALVERWVTRQGKPLIYLLDDPLYIPCRSPSNGWLSYLKFFGKVETLCRMSAVVLANSPSHAAFARKHNANVWEIPSVVDADVYTGWMPRCNRQDGRLCVGWSGSPSTVANLQVIRRPLKALSERTDIELLLIGAPDFGLPDVPHTGIEWRAETEVDDLRWLDIGLLDAVDAAAAGRGRGRRSDPCDGRPAVECRALPRPGARRGGSRSFFQRGAGNAERVDRVGLAALARGATRAGHVLRGDPHDLLAASDQEPLERAGDVAAILDRPHPLAVKSSRPAQQPPEAVLPRRRREGSRCGREPSTAPHVWVCLWVRPDHDHSHHPFGR